MFWYLSTIDKRDTILYLFSIQNISTLKKKYVTKLKYHSWKIVNFHIKQQYPKDIADIKCNFAEFRKNMYIVIFIQCMFYANFVSISSTYIISYSFSISIFLICYKLPKGRRNVVICTVLTLLFLWYSWHYSCKNVA